MQKTNVWIKVAGNSTRIKQGDSVPWRIYIESNPEEIQVRDCIIEGQANKNNLQWHSDPKGVPLLAWVSVFGDVTVENEIAYITLR